MNNYSSSSSRPKVQIAGGEGTVDSIDIKLENITIAKFEMLTIATEGQACQVKIVAQLADKTEVLPKTNALVTTTKIDHETGDIVESYPEHPVYLRTFQPIG